MRLSLFKRKDDTNGQQTGNADQSATTGLLSNLKKGLAKTRSLLTLRIDDLVLGKKEIDNDLMEQLEEILIKAHERGETFYVEELGGDELKRHYVYLRTLPGVKETLDDIEKAGFPVPTFQIFHLAYFSKGFLLFITYEPVPEAWDIF